ncbi:hypothetical protein, unlikely [Trypanosoma brucei gambiense DAL972]|uniref:Uncharacterized protein n=1 Tax=Trypanosoma brucei gambiense (strain MHOM/CI/86/DAL972) TaxID=679716 RepID=C9ZPC5_TRYB9|nr:hypothetical protein, unlikely [Trypanosoma brucei gambiense DAL972]CBH11253.1 hypothetical protein, unlikely [Trypanosoma brucei gambiense DAL972]|eukprot:XP_011773540.1 hypothetical protein, unlikely [Trypanosoma brucei gambiense DAL972]
MCVAVSFSAHCLRGGRVHCALKRGGEHQSLFFFPAHLVLCNTRLLVWVIPLENNAVLSGIEEKVVRRDISLQLIALSLKGTHLRTLIVNKKKERQAHKVVKLTIN